MRTSLQNRSVVFFVQDGCLVRIVAGKGGDDRAYTHRCAMQAFETVLAADALRRAIERVIAMYAE